MKPEFGQKLNLILAQKKLNHELPTLCKTIR
jgi:hypothetical protein